ncbi:DUF1877 family protein [Streptomyces sp. NBC_01304]|uniref:DUF1877 family protein n=1 Tax=Streptomyces sp. NBC_01304 TaxID=2903818 RepID=UPI002E13DA53|nr:DUF1877 family protein [Streptomyces sp. NBC_01304]
MYFHLRAVPPGELRGDVPWFEGLFADDWDAVRERCAEHREVVLDKRYVSVDELYTGTRGRPGTGEFRDLPVLGAGQVIPREDERMPPFVVLGPELVARATEFLVGADFAELWRARLEDHTAWHGAPEPEAAAAWRDDLAQAHRELTEFYVRAAEAGDVVVKTLLI